MRAFLGSLLILLALSITTDASCKRVSQSQTSPSEPCRTKPTHFVSDHKSCTLTPLKIATDSWQIGHSYDINNQVKCCVEVGNFFTPLSPQLHCGDGSILGFELQTTEIIQEFKKTWPQGLIHIPVQAKKSRAVVSDLPVSNFLDGRIYIMDSHGSFKPKNGDGIPQTDPDTKVMLAQLNAAAIKANHIKVLFLLSCSVNDVIREEIKVKAKEHSQKVGSAWQDVLSSKLKPVRLMVCDSQIKKSGLFIVHANPLHVLKGHLKVTIHNIKELFGWWVTFSSDKFRDMAKYLAKTDIDEKSIETFIKKFHPLPTENLSNYSQVSQFHYCMFNDLEETAKYISSDKSKLTQKGQLIAKRMTDNKFSDDDLQELLKDYFLGM